jgi:pSer/pThr/pTyr-binding forkhead associated (FHA) protein
MARLYSFRMDWTSRRLLVQLILRITGGPAQGRRIVIRRGQVAQIGRTEWADFSISRDQNLADVHFSIEWIANGYRVTDLKSETGTFVNGEPITTTTLRTGDQLRAGDTLFDVEIEGESLVPFDSGSTAVSGATTESAPSDDHRPTVLERCATLPLSEAAREQLAEVIPASTAIECLIEQKLFPDAIRVMAFLLPKRSAVQWSAQCVAETIGDGLTAAARKAIEAATTWARDDSEENRRAAEAAAKEVGTGSPAAWVALAAFWSGGSIAPAGLPEVPPGPALTSRAITAALLIVAPHGKPELMPERFKSFLEQGLPQLPDTSD